MNLLALKNALSILLFFFTVTVFAKAKHPATGEVPHSTKSNGLEFIENKGQWLPEARFMADVPGGVMFVTDKGFVYNYSSQADLERIHEMADQKKEISKEIVHSHAYRVDFIGCNNNVSYKSENRSVSYNNYYLGNDPKKWASNVGKFGKVTLSNVYNGIDLMVYSKNNQPKYDFVLHAGADPSLIRLSFNGVKPVLDNHGDLVLKTSVNELKEQAPYAYQLIEGKEIKVASRYKLDTEGNISFEFPEGYNKTYGLVIDPVLVFATYSGGVGSPGFYSYSSTYDALGNMYAGCQAYNMGWPTTLGASQSILGGIQDVGINKYNATGSSLIYSTYYGGAGIELPHSMLVNSQGELIVAGSTTSSNLPFTTNAIDSTINGTMDLFIAHFNSNGTALIGSTYLGGTGQDPYLHGLTGVSNSPSLVATNTISPVELLTESNGDIWLASCTGSSNFPVTTNAQQSVFGGGVTDGLIVRVNSLCSQMLYASYLGGSGDEGIVAIQHNAQGNLVVGGITTSTNFPTTTGCLHPTNQGGATDGFVSILNKATGVIIKSTYIGTANADNTVAIQLDLDDNVYVLGVTTGSYPITTGVFNVATGNVFIDKLSPSLSTSLLSTRLGATSYFPTAFLVDKCDNIYVCGLGASAGMPTTPDAFSTSSSGKFWFGVLEPNFSALFYGSYFGITGDHTHVGVNRLDPNGIVYHSICNNSQYPFTQQGVYAPIKLNGSGQDIVSFKFNFEATGVNSNFILDTAVSRNDTGCVPYLVHFINNSTFAVGYSWDFGDGTPLVTTVQPTHTYTSPGVYIVSLRANNDTSCVTVDTSFMTITVLKTIMPDFSVNDTTICSLAQNIDIGLTQNNPGPNNRIQWGPATGIVGVNNTPHITVNPTLNNLYYVVVKDTIPGICGVSKSDTVHINLRPRVLDILNNDTVVCYGSTIQITTLGTAGYTYKWLPATGVSDSLLLSPMITINQPDIYTITASYPECPDTSVSIQIGMQQKPQLTISPDVSVCQWTDVALESDVTPYRNDYIYSWLPATANLSNPASANTHLIADSSVSYTLLVKTPIGCADTERVHITVFPGHFGWASPDTGYCAGINGSVLIEAGGGTHYAWTPGYALSDTTIQRPTANPGQTTEYTVYITSAYNCRDTEKVVVNVYPSAILDMPDSVTVYPGEKYQLQPGTNCSYFEWFPSSGLSDINVSDPFIAPAVRTRYFVRAITEHGCMIKDSLDVLVKETVIDMPNAFNANSNNIFKPAKRGIASLKEFSIYNRWGNKVYSSKDIDNGWDGSYNGKPQPMGVYIYTIDAITDSGHEFVQKGNVTLIR